MISHFQIVFTEMFLALTMMRKLALDMKDRSSLVLGEEMVIMFFSLGGGLFDTIL